MRKYSIDARRVHCSIRLVVTLFFLSGFLVQNVAGSAFYSLLMEPNTTVTLPPVSLQAGTAGSSTIYTNNTSARVSVVAPVASSTPIFESGFETGNFSEWTETVTATGCSITIVTSPRHDGSYAARSYTDNINEWAVAREDFGQLYATLFARSYVQFTALPAVDGDVFRAVYIMHVSNASPPSPWYYNLAAAGVKNVGGTSEWYLQFWNGTDFSELTAVSPLPEANKWYSVEIKAVRSGTAGEARLWIDGTEILSATGLDNDAWTTNSRVEVGLGGDPSNNPTTIYLDSAKVAEAYIGPEAHYYDFVDNNASNVDPIADIGTHSNFTAQQYGPDLINDTLTEENTGGSGSLWVYVDADDETRTDWVRVGTNPYLDAIDYNTNYVYASGNNLLVGDFGFTDSGKSTETINNVTVQIYAQQSSGRNLEVFVWNGSSWTSLGVQTLTTSWRWENYTATTVLDTWAKVDGAKIYLETVSSAGTYEVDSARLQVDYTAPDNYELDLGVQWTNADFEEPNEELCIYGGTMGAENITIDVWNGSGWENLLTDLNSGWNNVSVASYLTASNFTIRFKGGSETGDTTQNTWDIDATLLHVWTEAGTGSDFNYVLNMTENDGSNWKVRLRAYDQSNIDRLKNCSIYIYDGSNSTQIIILNGTYNQQTGPWYDLAASGTEYIWMHVEVFGVGTSYVYVYLEIRVPTATIYARYIIRFEIT